MIIGAQAEGVGRARARSVLQWTGALGAEPRWGMRAAVAVFMPCSERDVLRPRTLCVSASSGQFGPKGTVYARGGYGVPVFTQNSTGIAPDTAKVL